MLKKRDLEKEAIELTTWQALLNCGYNESYEDFRALGESEKESLIGKVKLTHKMIDGIPYDQMLKLNYQTAMKYLPYRCNDIICEETKRHQDEKTKRYQARIKGLLLEEDELLKDINYWYHLFFMGLYDDDYFAFCLLDEEQKRTLKEKASFKVGQDISLFVEDELSVSSYDICVPSDPMLTACDYLYNSTLSLRQKKELPIEEDGLVGDIRYCDVVSSRIMIQYITELQRKNLERLLAEAKNDKQLK